MSYSIIFLLLSCIHMKHCEKTNSLENVLKNRTLFLHNYEDFAEKENNINNVTKNLVDSITKRAKVLAKSMSIGDNATKEFEKNSTTLLIKDTGKSISAKTINLFDVTIVPSKDFENSTHVFDIFFTVWAIDLMSWNSKKIFTSTKTAHLQFWHANCQKHMHNFKNPAEIWLKVDESKNFKEIFWSHKITVPENSSHICDHTLNQFIKIHKISVPKRATVSINFKNVELEEALQVVTTFFSMPTIEDFNKSYEITGENKSIFVVNSHKYDVWCYLGILPRKSSKNQISYNVSFVLMYCISWDYKNVGWKIVCKPGRQTNRSIINCECNHFSIISGYLQNSETRIQEVYVIEIELEMEYNYIIFITLATTFGVYCLLLHLTAWQKKTEIFYLADNVKNHQYAYLVVVRTESSKDAGTTSKVVIRLIGETASSEPHVLNYPDSKIYLLQFGGEDMFVLTAARFLGDILKIELWYDCSGPSPSWSCRDIVVYDMQQRKQWYFKVKTLFMIDECTYLLMAPSEEEHGSFWQKFRVCNQFHTWQFWAGENNFKYPARITTVFSNILLVYMMVMIMLGIPRHELNDCFDKFEAFTINRDIIKLAFGASISSFTLHVLLAWIFRLSDIEFVAFKKLYITTHKMSFFCWILLGLFISQSMTFLLLYGFWVPYHSSLIWLVCCLMAVIFDIVVLENIFIIIQTFICKFKLTLTLDDKFDSIINVITYSREYLYSKFDAFLLRPTLKHLYRPLRRVDILVKKFIIRTRRVIYNDLEDVVMYGTYNLILYLIILYTKGTLTVVSKASMEDLMQGSYIRTSQLSDIHTIYDVYNYINNTLIPTMQPLEWYQNYPLSNTTEIMLDAVTKFIGVARLRQHRVAANRCAVPKIMNFMNMSCWPEFSESSAEKSDFGPAWSQYQLAQYRHYHNLKEDWKYKSAGETKTLQTMGYMARYGGGGYVAFFSRNIENTFNRFHYLWENLWLEHRTRSLLIEFLAYNANYNIFIAVRLYIEQSAVGYMLSKSSIEVVRMLYVQNESETTELILFVFFIAWILLLMLKLFIGIVRHYKTFFRRFWLMIDLIINIMSIISVTLFIVRMKMVETYLESTHIKSLSEFTSYFNMLYIEDFLTYFSACLVISATIRLWRFLRFGLFFKILEKTLKISSQPLLGVTFNFFLILTAYGLSGVIIFGLEFPELSSFIKIVSTLVQLALKPDQFNMSDYTVHKIAYLYFASYLIMMQIILNTYVTVIIIGYTKAQFAFSALPDSYTVNDYFSEKLDYIPKIIRFKIKRLRGGQPQVKRLPVTPKADEFRLANSLSIYKSKMKSMRFIVSCIIRNIGQTAAQQEFLTPYETSLMLSVCNTFVLRISDRKELEFDVFFKGHFEGQKIRLVDEQKINRIAQFVQIFLKGEELAEQKPDPLLDQCTKLVKKKVHTLKSCTLQLISIIKKIETVDELLDKCLNEEEFYN